VPFSSTLGRFSKVFFRAGEESGLFGRVQLPLSAVSDRVYANYFSCGIGPSVIPGALLLSVDFMSSTLQGTWIEFTRDDLTRLSELQGVRGTYINWWVRCKDWKVWTMNIHEFKQTDNTCRTGSAQAGVH
jgi:hypothetical protein